MRKQQVIQLLQFIAIWVFVRLFVVFVANMSFVDFVLKYRLYLLIVSISYFYYYSIQYEPDKKYQFIRRAIVCLNVYLFAHIFFRPLLNISHELFVALWLIVLWIWGTTKMKSRWKRLLQIFWGILSFFILISGVFYLYPDEPDIKWFIDWRSYEIFVVGAVDTVKKSDAYIQITDGRRIGDFEIIPWFSKSLTESCKISYPSLRINRWEKVIFMTPQWDVVRLFPQWEIQLEFSWKKLIKLSKLTWKVWFLSWVFTWTTKFVWWMAVLSEDEQEQIEMIQNVYKHDFVEYLKDQISENNMSLANNTIMYNIDWKIIKFLVKLFPASFSKNLRNYNEFQYYFSWDSWDDIDLGRYSLEQMSWWSVKSFRENLKSWMQIGRWGTYKLFKKY